VLLESPVQRKTDKEGVMQDLQRFRQVIGELLAGLGFETAALSVGQEVVSLDVEERFTVHFGAIDESSWFMLAELGQTDPTPDSARYGEWLRGNRLSVGAWQPVVALDAQDRLVCWLRLPLSGQDLPTLTGAFGALIAAAERLLGTDHAEPAQEATQIHQAFSLRA
jgi:Tir chaperone protein (CesT) family